MPTSILFTHKLNKLLSSMLDSFSIKLMLKSRRFKTFESEQPSKVFDKILELIKG